jgi:hypothetical protein
MAKIIKELIGNKFLIGLIITLFTVIIVLSVLLSNCKTEGFCGTCQGMDTKVCTDRELLNKLYVNGLLTEDSDLIRSKKWPSIEFDNFSKNQEDECNSNKARSWPSIEFDKFNSYSDNQQTCN